MCMIQRNFLPSQVQSQKACPAWPLPVTQILLQTTPFQVMDSTHPQPSKTSTNVTPTIDLAVLKVEIKQENKNSLLKEFNAIVHQEITSMCSELESSISALCQQSSTEKLPNPKAVLNSIVKPEVAALHAEIKATFDQVHEYLMLLHKQIQVYSQAAIAKQKSPKQGK